MNRSESVDNTCPVCHDIIDIHAIGPCDHPVCYRCSTRMRVLCETADCPICRSLMPQVAFVHQRLFFKDINLRDCIPNRKYKIFYEDEQIEERYLNLLEFRCRLCPSRKSERTFESLKTHMRRDHQLFACDLCLTHLKIFPYERKFYDRKNLATHRRLGDPDDKSYKGHPLCEFCDARYNDKDELLKHLRKDHYFCHFCDQDGSNAYYNEYPDLKQHFADSHFLCTDDLCGHEQTRFTHAFASDIDLKAHKATVHNKNMSKMQSKETRQIEVDFQFQPRRQGYNGRGGSNNDFGDTQRGGRGGSRYTHQRRHHRDDPDLHRALAESMEMSGSTQPPPPVQERVPDPVHDFPSLNGATAAPSQVIHSKPKTPEEDFPSLSMAQSQGGPSQTHPVTKGYASAMNFVTESKPPPKAKEILESKPVVIGSVSSKSKDRWATQAPRVTEENFPSLGGKELGNGASNVSLGSNWSKTSYNNNIDSQINVITSKPFVGEQSANVKRMSPKKIDKNLGDKNDFPSLEGSGRENSVLANTLWSKPKSAKKTNQQPRSQKFDDSFEIPECYSKTYEQQEATSNITTIRTEENVNNGTVKRERAAPVPNKTSDFPSLPGRDKKNKTKPKEKKDSKEKTSSSKSKKSADGLSSLNDIAHALVDDKDSVKKTVNGKTSKATSKSSSQLKTNPKPKLSNPKPDWFDNPPQMEQPSKDYDKPTRKSSPIEDVTNGSTVAVDNSFPSLHTMSTPIQNTRAPPGFSTNPQVPASVTNAAPPGFSKSLTAPPGFSTVKNPSQYIQPAEFSVRNQQLIKDIHSCLCTVEDGFQNFKLFSGQYRQGLLEAMDYYSKCLKLMGREDFSKIFPELLVLLPDVAKQQELWTIHQMSFGNKAGQSAKSRALWKEMNEMSPCARCGQVILLMDEQHHNLQHGEQNDFPALGDDTSKESRSMKESGNSLKGAWIKAK